MMIANPRTNPRSDPAITTRDTLQILRDSYGPIIRGFAESEVDSLDEAMLLDMFVPARTADVDRWVAENAIKGDDVQDWLDDHPNHSLMFKLLMRNPVNVVAVH